MLKGDYSGLHVTPYKMITKKMKRNKRSSVIKIILFS